MLILDQNKHLSPYLNNSVIKRMSLLCSWILLNYFVSYINLLSFLFEKVTDLHFIVLRIIPFKTQQFLKLSKSFCKSTASEGE